MRQAPEVFQPFLVGLLGLFFVSWNRSCEHHSCELSDSGPAAFGAAMPVGGPRSATIWSAFAKRHRMGWLVWGLRRRVKRSKKAKKWRTWWCWKGKDGWSKERPWHGPWCWICYDMFFLLTCLLVCAVCRLEDGYFDLVCGHLHFPWKNLIFPWSVKLVGGCPGVFGLCRPMSLGRKGWAKSQECDLALGQKHRVPPKNNGSKEKCTQNLRFRAYLVRIRKWNPPDNFAPVQCTSSIVVLCCFTKMSF